MALRLLSFVLFLLMLPYCPTLAQQLSGVVYDAKTRQPIPFATIKYGDGGQGTITGLDGSFSIPSITGSIEVSSLGYQSQKIAKLQPHIQIFLAVDNNALSEVTVKPQYDKIRRIINNAIANKPQNNPDNYNWYRCHVYYKMLADALFPDSVLNNTSQDSREIKEFNERQHLLMSETYSIRTWKQPLHLHEDIIASRFSGLKKPGFTSLVTDFQPFHAYNDYLTLNGKDYHNPVSRGFEQYYSINLSDELLEGTDTVWILSFIPKGNNSGRLAGKVYINSAGYAISRIMARSYDTLLKLNVRIEQQYERIQYGAESKWFPAHLNYIVDLGMKLDNIPVTYHLVGYSRIDSVNFREDMGFRFDKAHTIRKANDAESLPEEQWTRLRHGEPDTKEANTYHFIDSIGEDLHLDKWLSYLSKLPESKVPVKMVDIDIRRLVSINKYERWRVGLGLQTNEKLVRWLSVGGWFGYGSGDREWKYGAFAEVYADRYKEFVFRIGYNNDLTEPGRVHLHRDLDKGYLKRLLLSRVDQVKEFNATVRKKTGYLELGLCGAIQQVIPRYNYHYPGVTDSIYAINEISLNFRYAYAERTVPFFNIYKKQASKYPVFYGRIATGRQTWQTGGKDNNYLQALVGMHWHKHINRLGNERILLVAGKSWSEQPLPLGKLFAGNGYRYDSKSNTGLYTFGGLMNIYPYEYYSDQFINLIIRHDFDWKIFKLEKRNSSQSMAPNLALQYNMLYGSLSHPWAQQGVQFSIPDNAFNEVGLIINNFIRYRYFDLYYLTLNIGYFAHVIPEFNAKKDGRIVYGIGIEL